MWNPVPASERPEAGRQGLGAQADEALVRGGRRLCRVNHLRVRVDAQRLLDERGEQVRLRSGAAADVEQASPAVEVELVPDESAGAAGHGSRPRT